MKDLRCISHCFSGLMALSNRFYILHDLSRSVNFRPNEETLSKHSILGPGGLRAQWQPPKNDTKVS